MPSVLYEVRDHTAYIQLNRPEALNAINNELAEELEAAWYRFDADPEAWVAILTGNGDRAFCSGRDLRARASGEQPFRLRSLVFSVYLPTLLFAIGQGAILPVIPLFARDLGASVAIASLA